MRKHDQCLEALGKLAGERAPLIVVVEEDIEESNRTNMVAAVRQLIEVDNHKALVSVKLLDQHRAVVELVGPAFNKADFPHATLSKTRGHQGRDRLGCCAILNSGRHQFCTAMKSQTSDSF